MIAALTQNPIATLAAACMLFMFTMSLFKDVRLAVPRWMVSLLLFCLALYAINSALGNPTLQELRAMVGV